MRRSSLTLLLVLAVLVAPAAQAQAIAMLGTLGKLGVSPVQALGGAKALLGVAQSNLSGDEFSSLMGAAPQLQQVMELRDAGSPMGGRLRGGNDDAPAAAGDLPALPAGIGSLDGLASNADLVSQFADLGLDAGMITKFAPVLLDVASKAGPDALGLLSKGLGIG